MTFTKKIFIFCGGYVEVWSSYLSWLNRWDEARALSKNVWWFLFSKWSIKRRRGCVYILVFLKNPIFVFFLFFSQNLGFWKTPDRPILMSLIWGLREPQVFDIKSTVIFLTCFIIFGYFTRNYRTDCALHDELEYLEFHSHSPILYYKLLRRD